MGMRLYMYAYERMRKAKELADKQMKNLQKPAVTADIIRTHESLMQGEVRSEEEKKDTKPQQDHFSQFLKVIQQYFTDQIDTVAFEEECKKLLGYQAWIVFTYDKLFAKLQKVLQNIFEDELSMDLVNAFKYENQRVNKFLDNSYYIQAYKQAGRAPLYLMEYNQSSQQIVVNLMSPPDIDDRKIDAEALGLKYIRNYLSTNVEENTAKVFLNRNKKVKNPFQNTLILNNLEYKVCLATYKMFYVEDTTDLLYRKQQQNHAQTKKLDSDKFAKWLAKRQV